MSRRPARFTQADIHRAIKAVMKSGADMAVEVTGDGTIRIARNAGVSHPAAAKIETHRAIVL